MRVPREVFRQNVASCIMEVNPLVTQIENKFQPILDALDENVPEEATLRMLILRETTNVLGLFAELIPLAEG